MTKSEIYTYAKYAKKALVAAAAAATLTVSAMTDGVWTIDEFVECAVAWAAVAGVYLATNAPAQTAPTVSAVKGEVV